LNQAVMMTSFVMRLVTTGLIFLMILPSGYLLTRIGKPYPMLLITVHKLAGVAAGVYLVVSLLPHYQAGELRPLAIAVLIITVACFLVLVVSGSLLSAEREFPSQFKVLHKVFPYLTVLASLLLLMLAL
jgi:hypothetical protein